MRMEPDTMPQGGKLLILDLDETLVHASERELERSADFRLVGYHVYLRPQPNVRAVEKRRWRERLQA